MMDVEYGSDLLVDELRALGIDYIALNPGATIRGLHESLVARGNRNPELVLTTHEGVAVAIAHGYAKAAGRPMAVGLHNIVGLQHASMALFNAWCDRVPMIVIGGSGPAAESRRRPWIDWVHAGHQGELVRDYVKWEHEPTELGAVVPELRRAWQICMAQPQGPVYLAVDADLQEAPMTDAALAAARRLGSPADASVSAGTISPEIRELIVSRLVAARRPLILASGMFRGGAVEAVVELAELLNAPVIEWMVGGTSIPSRHPLNGSHWGSELIAESDLILALNVQNLASVLHRTDDMARTSSSLVSEGVQVIAIGADLLPSSSWTNEHGPVVPAGLAVRVDAVEALAALVEHIRTAGAAPSGAMASSLAARRADAQRDWETTAGTFTDPLSLANLAYLVREAIGAEGWVLANGTAGQWVHRLWDLSPAHPYLGDSGGAGKGYGIGAAIGAALALKGTGKIAINLQGDGDLLYTPGALWTAAHHQVPLLTVVLNNRSYFQDERHQVQMGVARGRPETDVAVGIRLEGPPVDYAALANSFGVRGFGPVSAATEVRSALQKAVALVRAGTPTVVDCVVAGPAAAS